MIRYFELAGIFICLLTGFLLWFWKHRILERMQHFLRVAKSNMEESNRIHLLEKRRSLANLEEQSSFWFSLERELEYSGVKRRHKNLTGEMFLAGNLLLTAGLFFLGGLCGGTIWGITFVLFLLSGEYLYLQLGKMKNMRMVSDNLMKFLDFLGNYSITSGELTSIFSQISRYLDEPLAGVLEECEAQSKLTGDVGLAVLEMADKIEHPQFQQLVRNIEISTRYSADYTTLVMESRRNLREYLRQSQERKGMLREGAINMGLLLIMSVVVLLSINGLIEASVWDVLFHTIPGYIALGITAGILVLFLGQVMKMGV